MNLTKIITSAIIGAGIIITITECHVPNNRNNSNNSNKIFPQYAINDTIDKEFIKTEEISKGISYFKTVSYNMTIMDSLGKKIEYTDVLSKSINGTYEFKGIYAISIEAPTKYSELLNGQFDFKKEQIKFDNYKEKILQHNLKKNNLK